MKRPTIAIPAALGYLGAIVLANYLIVHGFPGATYSPFSHTYTVPVLFGLVAPAGVYVVALSWPARDLVQLGGSRALGIAAIFVGALVSWWVANPAIAVASGGTLLISETADFLVYTPMQRRLVWAVVASSLIGAVLDSVIFLSWSGIGFGPGGVILKGQIVGKATTVLLIGLPVALMLRRTDSVKELLPA